LIDIVFYFLSGSASTQDKVKNLTMENFLWLNSRQCKNYSDWYKIDKSDTLCKLAHFYGPLCVHMSLCSMWTGFPCVTCNSKHITLLTLFFIEM